MKNPKTILFILLISFLFSFIGYAQPPMDFWDGKELNLIKKQEAIIFGLIKRIDALEQRKRGAENGRHPETSSRGATTCLDSLLCEEWTTPPFAAGDYSVYNGTGSWVVEIGDVLAHRYKIVGKTMHWNVFVQFSTIANTPTLLGVKMPAGVMAKEETNFCGNYENYTSNSTFRGVLVGGLGEAILINYPRSTTGFNDGTNTQGISFSITFEIE